MAETPTIGVVIATPGRASLYRTLRSILYQGLVVGDDVLVVGDGFHQATKDLVDAFGPPFRYIATQATRDWGHSQSNYGFKHVKGDMVVYQDDDDIFLPRAFDEMRRLFAANPDRPMIGRVKTPLWGLLWHEPGTKTLLDGHCMVVPNDKAKLGFMTLDYNGDQAYISTCIERYKAINWVDRVWTLTRPEWKLFPTRHQPLTKYMPPDKMKLYSDMTLRLIAVIGKLDMTDDYTWWFHDDAGALQGAVRIFEASGSAHATVAYNDGAYAKELVEFAAWSAQGLDCTFYSRGDDEDPALIEALHGCKFEDHVVLPTNRDYTMYWPPKWFPFQVAVEITDGRGVRVPDWRDRWSPDE